MKEVLRSAIRRALEKAIESGELPPCDTLNIELTEVPDKKFGDFATNIAMKSAKVFHLPPKKIAEVIVKHMGGGKSGASCACPRTRSSMTVERNWLHHTEVAGPGFLNFFLKEDVLYNNFGEVFAIGEKYGRLPSKDMAPVMIEYVSANPTGPLHVGHGRGAAAGSALVNILRAAGYPVKSEYYINDAGNQMDNLARSVNARYLELMGREVSFPEDGYHGQDIVDTAKNIIAKDGDKYLAMEEAERLEIFKDLAYAEKLAMLKKDLADFGVTFDVWFSERTLHQGDVQKSVDFLKTNGAIYEKEGALWLASTKYGDDKDRVVIRENGEPTYLAADIAYHKNKLERGFGKMIDLWGADHHGYICRVKAALSALGYDSERLKVLLLQMVSLYRGGEMVKMSKRTGESITLRELMEEVGVDAARFFFLMRSLDSQLDFDLDLAKKQESDNPVYYIQYAHARIKSIFRQAGEAGLNIAEADPPKFTLLTDESEIDLIKKIMDYPEEIEKAAAEYAPQRITRYAYDLAGLFHSFYNRCRIMGQAPDLAKARLALLKVTAHVIKSALGLLGVSAPDSM